MNLDLLSSKNDAFRFALFSTIIAFIIGVITYTIPMATEHIYFFISAPIATFLPCYLLWEIAVKRKNDYKISNVILISFGLTIITHYLNFVILGLGRLICYSLTGYCADYNGEVEGIIETLTYTSILRALISLFYWGILTLILFIVTGIYIIKTSKK